MKFNYFTMIMLLIVGLAIITIQPAQVQAQSGENIHSVFPERLQSWVEVKADSLEKTKTLAQEVALAKLDSIAQERSVKIDTVNVTYHMTYLGPWTEMEGRGRRKHEVQKGFRVRMMALAPIVKGKK
ncbi:MAG: hypothetical protein GXO75_07965 [Calditrichaeota bacterium]|nr:hypothetical protein [Calditrichota bacterium]